MDSALRPTAALQFFSDSTDKFKLYTLDDLRDLPPAEWLVGGLFEQNTQVVLFGPPGAGKSILALDWALSIATGTSWHGHAVKFGHVVYVAAEGLRGTWKRAAAWMEATGREPDRGRLVFVQEPPQLHRYGQCDGLVRRFEDNNLKPSLIILDTLARTFVAGEENSAKEMGAWVEGARNLQYATGATVLTLHHTIKRPPEGQERDERGSSSLRGAMDTMMSLQKKGMSLTLKCVKQKDEDEFDPISLTMHTVVLTGGARTLSSVVLVPETNAVSGGSMLLSPAAAQVLEALRSCNDAQANAELLAATFAAAGQPRGSRTISRHLNALLAHQKIEAVPGRRGWYRAAVTDPAIATELPTDCHGNAA